MEFFSLKDCTLIRFDEKDSHVQLGYMYDQGPTPLYILNYDERNAILHNATCMILTSDLTKPNVLSITKVFNYHSCHVRYSDRNLFIFFFRYVSNALEIENLFLTTHLGDLIPCSFLCYNNLGQL